MRAVLDRIYHETLRTDPATMEFLTVDAPQDGACLLARLEADAHPAYDRVYRLLTRTAGCSAGRRVANIAPPSGNVYPPCQFAQFEEFLAGNVRNRPFGEIWNDPENPVLAAFRADGTRTGSPCSTCGRREVCGTGGCRVRAYIRSGDLNGGDPLCLRHG
ncbi:SPASM domain-containing protein [Methanoculleus chikugoensis]|uniref:SPASM domain-containing protein n=1 Tax=Methanoculleus chikugoensis TaxID=118126 RepID=UPI000A4A3783|nr:SPASM domain-containing protein [Methanoculleus chikugoensis]